MRTIDLPVNPTGHAAPVTHVTLRPDGQRLASCSYDGTVLVWDTAEPVPRPLHRLRHRRLVNASAWNPVAPGLLATASADKTVAVWRIPDAGGRAQLVNVLARHTDDINAVDWMPDGERLICVSEDGRATLWDALDGAFLSEIGSHTAHCMAVSVSPDGIVATVGEDGMVAVSRPGSNTRPTTRHYDSSIEGCAWSRSGDILAVARDDGAVDLLTPGLDLLRTLAVSGSAARTVGWSEDDASLIVGAYDGSLHFFDQAGKRTHQVYDARVWPRSVSVAAGLVAAGSFWNGPHLYRLADAAEVAAPDSGNHGPNAMTAAGGELYIGCDSGAVFAVQAGTESGRPLVRALLSAEGPVLSLAARDGTVYAGTYAGHVISVRDGRHVTSEQLGAPLPSLCFDGDRLVAGTYNGDLVVLDLRTLAVTERHRSHEGSVKSLAAMPGGFLSAATDRTIAAGRANKRNTLWEHGNLVNAVAVLDGRVAASASRDHTVKVGRIGRLPSGRWQAGEVQTLLGPDESVKCVGLIGDADAPVVLAGSYDFGLYVWHVDWEDNAGALSSGHLLAEFSQGVSCMAPLESGQVAVAGWDGRVLIVGVSGDGQVGIIREWRVDELAAFADAQAPEAEELAGSGTDGREEAVTA
ncbi:repetative protein [Streptomyces sp. OF3]|uniref:Repetative protein n=1 Tax=Streptomyces alkaliterrae TaxID=2213162 RepID=A0A7W3WHR5_9ACTN|nr:WD40 repeat domain-containing protein [Streptomyces alkaliterrae]MBB1252601.1 repetative protein [Streptomyces alkaliterrae]